MYYSSGNYEAFARPQKPAGVDHKSGFCCKVLNLLSNKVE